MSDIKDDPKIYDLEPRHWDSEREKPKEPVFGPGWPIAVGVLMAVVFATVLIEMDVMPRQLAAGIGGILGTLTGLIASAFQR